MNGNPGANSSHSVQYYLDMIHAMPNLVYWIDLHCQLQGCNYLFSEMLGFRSIRDCKDTPYEQFVHCLKWPDTRVDALKSADLAVIFSEKATYSVIEAPIEDKNQHNIYYQSTRVPLFDSHKHVIGLLVILEDITTLTALQSKNQPNTTKAHHAEEPFNLQKKPRILMVEDNPIAQHVEKLMFIKLNCDVLLASTGEEAIQAFVPDKFDLILLDIGLEDTSGYVVAKKIRHMEKNGPHVPIVAITSYKSEAVYLDCKNYAMNGIITKPLSETQAKQLIDHFVYGQDVNWFELK